jgi:hypothetical protein
MLARGIRRMTRATFTNQLKRPIPTLIYRNSLCCSMLAVS